MVDRPIMFSAPMVRALLAGRKTQTRRLATSPLARAAIGDRFWVREAWRPNYAADDFREDLGRSPKPSEMDPAATAIEYLADGERELGGKDRPSMFMPRWASRLTLVITGVRTEPLHAITDEDALAEGVRDAGGDTPSYRRFWIAAADTLIGASAVQCYGVLWNSLRPAEGQRWQDNPEVLVLTFEVIAANIDADSLDAAAA